MITERDLQEAIAECQGVRNPTSSTCIKLAAYLTILNSMKEEPEQTTPLRSAGYSFAPAPENASAIIPASGDSEFSRLIAGRKVEDVLPEIISLVEAVQVVNPRLYNSFIARL